MTESNEFVPILSLNSIDQPTLLKRRVNLIEEHIDYAGFGVLPMAIINYVIFAVNFSNNKGYTNVRLSNIQKCWDFEGKIKSLKFIFKEGVSEWSTYFKCGYK
ncbi:22290_t:CDS:2, partial [Gigaspora margarita]